MRLNRAEMARLERNIRRTEACWFWTGPLMPNGYGKHRIGPGQPERAAHRIVYEHMVGPVPPGTQLDHLCRHRWCVNPAHLEPVTASENTLRQDHAERRVTVCPQGHPYDDENTLLGADGKRRCRECRRARRHDASNASPAGSG